VKHDLAGKPRCAGRVGGKIEQVFFLLTSRGQSSEVFRIDNDVASRASHHTLAGAFERLTGGPGNVQEPLSGGGLYFLVERAVRAEEAHQRHATSFSCASAASASRLQASITSSSLV